MRLMTALQRSPIAIDVGSRALKIAQTTTRGDKLIRRTFATMDRAGVTAPSDGGNGTLTIDLAQKVAGLIKRHGFIGEKVILAIPPDLLRMEALELPKTPAAAMRELGELEIGRVTRLKHKTFEHGLWELPAPSRGGSAVHALAVALPHADADALCQPFLDAGLEVITLYPQVSALAALVRRILPPPPDDQLHTLIDIGGAGTRLIILQRGDVLFHRAIQSFGITALERSLQSELGIPADIARHILLNIGTSARNLDGLAPIASRLRRLCETMADTIATELQLTQNYITHRYQQQTAPGLLLVGGGAAIPGLAELLGSATGRQATVLTPKSFNADAITNTNNNDPGAKPESPAHVAALAAALYAAEEET